MSEKLVDGVQAATTPKQQADTDNKPRMLTLEEIEALRRDKEESGAWLMEQMRKSRLARQRKLGVCRIGSNTVQSSLA